MNDDAVHLDQTDDTILTYTVSDETLEVASNAQREAASHSLKSWGSGETGCLPC